MSTNTEYRVAFKGDLGNLQQFINSVGSGLGRGIRQAYQTSSTAQVRSMTSGANPTGLSGTRSVTSTIDAYNRTLTQSGQIFHRFVSGWTADIQRLDAAASKLNAKLGAKGNIFGTAASLKAGRVGIRMADLVPTGYEEFITGNYQEKPVDYNKVERATKALSTPKTRTIIPIGSTAKSTPYTITESYDDAVSKTDMLRTGLMLRSQARIQSYETMGEERANALITSMNAITAEANRQLTQLTRRNQSIAKKMRAALQASGGNIAAEGFMTGPEATSVLGRFTQRAVAAGGVAPYANTQEMFAAASADANVRKMILKDLWAIRGGEANTAEATKIIADQKQKQVQVETAIATNEAETAALVEKEQATQKKINAKMEARAARVDKLWGSELAAKERAFKSTPDVPADLGYFLKTNKGFRKDFVRDMGITSPIFADQKAGIFTEDFKKQVQNLGITANATRDFERGVTRLGGAVKDVNGLTGEWSYTLGKNGERIQTWGRGLRGPGSALQQIGRDFQKVIEWTVATTAVFGTIGLLVGSFSKINQVNADLQRFQITAKTAGDETTEAFKNIARIAYETATPLTELTSVMDDIALATRRVNQTQAEWAESQTDLARAVGIFTNISGTDTVKATDMLSSAYKQLGIPTSQLEEVLNKVTAVGGGNAQAINDITSALGGLAEAAKAAGFTVDEMISSVQVLSQVTNKTSAEVATSFKNLFGAINSPASEKMLKSFNIEIRDAAGGLRPFLDIYRDIYKARQEGVIPENRMQDVFRAIAGGPRRAPDAAALLGNLPKIFETLETSVNASNDALIANAKILETNQAKMQQIRTAFDATLVEKFTLAVNKLVEVLSSVATTLNGAFGGLPDSLSSTLLQMTLILGAAALLKKGIFFLKNELLGLGKNLSFVGKQLSSISNNWGGTGSLLGWAVSGSNQARTQRLQQASSAVVSTSQVGSVAPFTAPRPNWSPTWSKHWATNLSPLQRSLITAGPMGTMNVPLGMSSAFDPNKAAGLKYYKSGPMAGQPYTVFGGRARPLSSFTLPYANQIKPIQDLNSLTVKQLALQGGAAGTLKNVLGNALVGAINRFGVGKLGVAAGLGAGIAGAGAIAAAGQGDIGAAGSFAQVGGLAAISLIGGPVGWAAGGALLAAGTAMQFIGEESRKASEQLQKTRLEVYDLAKAFMAQNTEVQNAKKSQSELSKELAIKTALENKTAEDYQRISALQNEYASVTLRVIEAQKALNDQQDRLLEILPELSKEYGALIALGKKGYITGPDADIIAQELAADILALGGVGASTKVPIGNYFNQQPGGPSYVGVKGQIQSLAGTPTLASDISESINRALVKGDWKSLGNLLSPSANLIDQYGLPAYANLDSNFFQAARIALARATPEERATEQFRNIVDLFGKYVAEFGDKTTRVQTAVSAYQTDIEARASIGALRGEELQNAMQRGSLAEALLGIRTEGRNTPVGWLGGNAPTVDPMIQNLLTEKGAITPTAALEAFKVVAEKYGEYQNLMKAGTFDNAAVDWLKAQGIEVAGLTDKVKGLAQEQDEVLEKLEKEQQLRESIKGAYEQTASGLGQDLLSLQAAFQSGEYKGNEDVYRRQVDQINALIVANRTLYNEIGQNTEPQLQTLGDTLGRVTGMFGLQFQSVEQLIGSVINWGRILGLTPEQIKNAIIAVMNLNKALILLQRLKDVQLKITVAVRRSTMAGGGSYSEDDLRNPANQAARQNATRINQAEAEINRLINQLSNLGSSGNPNWYSPSTGGGGGGGGGSSRQIGNLDLPDEWKSVNYKDYLKQAVSWAKKYQKAIPGETSKNRNDLVAVMLGNTRVLLQRGIGEEYLRKAIDKLTDEIKKQNDLLAKADTISRIRVGAGDFAALANVPMNSKTGISVGGPSQPISVNLNVNGQILTPAQLTQLANAIAAQIKKSYSA